MHSQKEHGQRKRDESNITSANHEQMRRLVIELIPFLRRFIRSKQRQFVAHSPEPKMVA